MRSVLMMALANIRKRKTQSILIGLTLLMAALLLATAVGMLESIQDPVTRMFESQNASHVTMMMPDPRYNSEDIVGWWEGQNEVIGVNRFVYEMVEEDFRHNGKQQSMGGMMITEYPQEPLTQDRLRIVGGETKDRPGKDELWVPTGYAYSWNLAVGDTLEIFIDGTYRSLTISAIVVDPQFSAGMVNPVRVWVENGFFAGLGKEEDEMGSIIGVRLSDDTAYDRLWQDFEEYLQAPYLGFVFEYEFVKSAYSMVQNILAVIMLAFSGMILLVSMFVLSFTITNGVMTDYRIIGILKAQGFSPAHVKWIYSLQYLLLALLAAPAGAMASRYLVRGIMSQMSRSLGIARLDASLMMPVVLTVPVIVLVTTFFSLLASAKAGRIKPAEAIRNTSPSAKSSFKRRLELSSLIALPVSFMLAVKNIFGGKRYSGFLLVSVGVLAFVLTFSVNTFHSVQNMDQNYAYWGFDDGDIYISANENAKDTSRETLLSILDADHRVQAVLPYQVVTNAAIPAQGGQTSKNVIGFMYDGDMDSMGILNLEGSNPRKSNEVAISYMVAQKYGKAVGDRIDLYLEGQKASYSVTGIYQCLNAMGWGIKFQEQGVRDINPQAYGGSYKVKLNRDRDITSFVEDMKVLLGEGYNIRGVSESGEINLSALTDNIALVGVLLSAIFMVVAFIIIFNTTTMEVYRDKKTWGIYNALGMTPAQIRRTILWKALVLSCIGMVLGSGLALLISPYILGMLIRNIGMVQFPFDLTVFGTLAMMPLCIITMAISAWMPSRRIFSISPRELVMD